MSHNKQHSKGKKSSGSPPKDKKKEKKGLAPGLLGHAGSAIGSVFGPIGSSIGKAAGDWLGKITGLGAYRVSKNSLMTNNGPPSFSKGGMGVVINHRECLGDISGSVGFTNTVYPINVGVESVFPWLSQVARRFEQYEVLGMIFYFRSTSGDALVSTNTALGTVIMSTQYNNLDPDFTNKIEMESYEFTISGEPAKDIIHPVECASNLNFAKNLYVRDGNLPVGADRNTYDLGKFQLATVGMQAAAVVGELWVSYHVRLLRPKIEESADAGGWSVIDVVSTAAGTISSQSYAYNGLNLGALSILATVLPDESRIPIVTQNVGDRFELSTYAWSTGNLLTNTVLTTTTTHEAAVDFPYASTSTIAGTSELFIASNAQIGFNTQWFGRVLTPGFFQVTVPTTAATTTHTRIVVRSVQRGRVPAISLEERIRLLELSVSLSSARQRPDFMEQITPYRHPVVNSCASFPVNPPSSPVDTESWTDEDLSPTTIRAQLVARLVKLDLAAGFTPSSGSGQTRKV